VASCVRPFICVFCYVNMYDILISILKTLFLDCVHGFGKLITESMSLITLE
jgi:hypothetical protein